MWVCNKYIIEWRVTVGSRFIRSLDFGDIIQSDVSRWIICVEKVNLCYSHSCCHCIKSLLKCDVCLLWSDCILHYKTLSIFQKIWFHLIVGCSTHCIELSSSVMALDYFCNFLGCVSFCLLSVLFSTVLLIVLSTAV